MTSAVHTQFFPVPWPFNYIGNLLIFKLIYKSRLSRKTAYRGGLGASSQFECWNTPVNSISCRNSETYNYSLPAEERKSCERGD
jgi:hypothetical protein